jgi:hypothetical protein
MTPISVSVRRYANLIKIQTQQMTKIKQKLYQSSSASNMDTLIHKNKEALSKMFTDFVKKNLTSSQSVQYVCEKLTKFDEFLRIFKTDSLFSPQVYRDLISKMSQIQLVTFYLNLRSMKFDTHERRDEIEAILTQIEKNFMKYSKEENLTSLIMNDLRQLESILDVKLDRSIQFSDMISAFDQTLEKLQCLKSKWISCSKENHVYPIDRKSCPDCVSFDSVIHSLFNFKF